MTTAITVSETTVKSILTRSTGYLAEVTSHSLQPYRGCTFGRSLCGVGCYVRHNRFLTRGEPWGSFLDARTNAADAYRAQYDREQRWGRRRHGRFGVFMSSSTDPFLPHEQRFRITAGVLEAMRELPPDVLVIQTHTHLVTRAREAIAALAARCELRVHLSIESDRDRLDGLPAPASPVARRLAAAAALKADGIRVVVTVSPLLPIADPEGFFGRIADSADAVVIDHYIEGDGSKAGSRTLRTALPEAMRQVDPRSLSLDYRDEMVAVAQRVMPGRVGISQDGFAGRLG